MKVFKIVKMFAKLITTLLIVEVVTGCGINNYRTPTKLNEDVLRLGTLQIDQLVTNDLNVCGSGGVQKCKYAKIVIYTNDLVTLPGVGGFVNTTEGYGLTVTADGKKVKHTAAKATRLQKIRIPSSKNKIQRRDFADTVYDIRVDTSNAGTGNYEMSLTLEFLVGR